MTTKSLLDEVSKEDQQLIQEFEEDEFCKILFDIFSKKILNTKLTRKLKSIQDSALKERTNFFLNNGNIVDIHKCLINQKACKIFLLIDDGYNLAQMSKELAPKGKEDLRPTVRHWINKYKKMDLIQDSPLSGKLTRIFEKNSEGTFPIKFLNYACIKNLKFGTLEFAKDSIGENILKRKTL